MKFSLHYFLLLIFATIVPSLNIVSGDQSYFNRIKQLFYTSSEQKEKAYHILQELLVQKDSLKTELKSNPKLSITQKKELSKKIDFVEKQILKQKIILGEKWSTTKKIAFATIIGSGLAVGITTLASYNTPNTPTTPKNPQSTQPPQSTIDPNLFKTPPIEPYIKKEGFNYTWQTKKWPMDDIIETIPNADPTYLPKNPKDDYYLSYVLLITDKNNKDVSPLNKIWVPRFTPSFLLRAITQNGYYLLTDKINNIWKQIDNRTFNHTGHAILMPENTHIDLKTIQY